MAPTFATVEDQYSAAQELRTKLKLMVMHVAAENE
jgi:hypothetical protein